MVRLVILTYNGITPSNSCNHNPTLKSVSYFEAFPGRRACGASTTNCWSEKAPPRSLGSGGLSVSCRHLPCRRSRRRARPNGLKARFRTCGCSNNPPSRPSVWWRAAVCAGPRRWPRGAWIRNLLGHHHLVGTQPRQRNDHPGQPHAAHRAGDMHGDRAGTPAGRAGRSRWTPPVRRVSCGRSFRACGAGRGSGRTAPASASSNSAVLRSAMSAMPLLSQIVSQQRRSMFSGKTTS